jgi:ABC-type transport system involved in cytochrome bd biosynthesis fused ATPase/permease subunit
MGKQTSHVFRNALLITSSSTRVILDDVGLDVQAGKKVFICGETGR